MKAIQIAVAWAVGTVAVAPAGWAAGLTRDDMARIVNAAAEPVMRQQGIPGMAIGVTVGGKAFVFDHGVMSVEGMRPVGPKTLFELGSISKTFTVTLAAWAQANHQLDLNSTAGTYLPSLRGTPFGNVTLIELATHTGGGFPLQLPGEVTNDAELMRYLAAWRPAFTAGTRRTYANPSVGMLGFITAKMLHQDFSAVMSKTLFPALGLADTFIQVPEERMSDYAQGRTEEGKPARLSEGILWAEAYGVKSTAADMLHFLQEQMNDFPVEDSLRHAITLTHAGWFQAGPMTQDLIWEQYAMPVTLATLLEGNGADMIFKPTPVTRLDPPMPPRTDVWLNKTGSTSGFAAYVAMIPARRLGIVILANRSFPISERVRMAYRILTEFEGDRPSGPRHPQGRRPTVTRSP